MLGQRRFRHGQRGPVLARTRRVAPGAEVGQLAVQVVEKVLVWRQMITGL